MKLTAIEVDIKPQIDGSIQVGGYFGPKRVIYEIPRERLDDYFPQRPHLSDADRVKLIGGNIGSIEIIMQRKCEQEAWTEVNLPGGSFFRLSFDRRDLDQRLKDC